MNKKWITYGVGGVVGVGILAGGAAAAAQAMDLRSLDGETIPGGSLGQTSIVVDPAPSPSATVPGATDTASVVTPTAATPATAVTPASAVSAPTANTPASVPTPSPVSPPSPVSVPSPASAASAPSN